jgi:Domain of unknown function (DUF932)
VNSHDRSSAYQLHCGLFRLVCTNGMVVSAIKGIDEDMKLNKALWEMAEVLRNGATQ